MNRSTRTKRSERRRQVARYFLKGWTQADIVAEHERDPYPHHRTDPLIKAGDQAEFKKRDLQEPADVAARPSAATN